MAECRKWGGAKNGDRNGGTLILRKGADSLRRLRVKVLKVKTLSLYLYLHFSSIGSINSYNERTIRLNSNENALLVQVLESPRRPKVSIIKNAIAGHGSAEAGGSQ